MSSSDVRRTANSNAKFGAAVNEPLLVASNCIHRAGFCMNDTGLISTAGRSRPAAGTNTPISIPCRGRRAATTPPWCPAAELCRGPRSSRTLAVRDWRGRSCASPRTPAGWRVDPDVYCRYAVFGWEPTFAAGIRGESKSSASISITRGARSPGLRLRIFPDVVDDRRRRQYRDRRAVTQRPRHPLVMRAELRHRKRDGDETGLYRAEEGDDVLQALRSQYRCPLTGRPAPQELLGDDLRSLVDLRPRQAFGKPCGIYLVVDERVTQCHPAAAAPDPRARRGWKTQSAASQHPFRSALGTLSRQGKSEKSASKPATSGRKPPHLGASARVPTGPGHRMRQHPSCPQAPRCRIPAVDQEAQ